MDFIYNYFIEPIIAENGYNIVNTTVYALLFLASIYLAREVMKRLGININKDWFWATVWIIPIGALLRVIEDWVVKYYGVLPTHFLFVTPGLYILLSGLVLTIAYLEKNNYSNRMNMVGKHLTIALSIVYVILLLSGVHNIWVSLLAVVTAGIAGYAVYKILEKFGYKGKEYLTLIMGHSLDGFVSSLSIMLAAYSEKHVVTGFLMKTAHPLAYPLIKVTLAAVAVVLIKDQVEEDDWKYLLLLFLTVIGLGPGTRDLLRLLLGI